MINNETHTIDWILDLRDKLGKRIDPKLIEKVIWALTLLEQLKINGLNFTFKGGTALLLAANSSHIDHPIPVQSEHLIPVQSDHAIPVEIDHPNFH